MNTHLKYTIILFVMAILFGLLAGVLAATVDLSLIEDYLPMIFVIAVVVNFGLIALAIKKGRIP